MPAVCGDARQAAGAARLDELRARARQAWCEALATWAQVQCTWENRPRRETTRQGRLATSEIARLYARLATLPGIEQAKGMLMAEQGCGEAEAFDLLRRASQRSNVPVRVLAERMAQNAQQEQPRRSSLRLAGPSW
jgi:hypothetical protein